MKLRTIWIAVLAAVMAAVLNATLRYARVEVDDEKVTASLGPLGFAQFPRSLVVDVHRTSLPWWIGYGIRIYGWQSIGFVGRPGRTVEFVLSKPVTVRAVFPMPARRLAVAVENPDELVRELTSGNRGETQAA